LSFSLLDLALAEVEGELAVDAEADVDGFELAVGAEDAVRAVDDSG
jgi:hypothetical protein